MGAACAGKKEGVKKPQSTKSTKGEAFVKENWWFKTMSENGWIAKTMTMQGVASLDTNNDLIKVWMLDLDQVKALIPVLYLKSMVFSFNLGDVNDTFEHYVHWRILNDNGEPIWFEIAYILV